MNSPLIPSWGLTVLHSLRHSRKPVKGAGRVTKIEAGLWKESAVKGPGYTRCVNTWKSGVCDVGPSIWNLFSMACVMIWMAGNELCPVEHPKSAIRKGVVWVEESRLVSSFALSSTLCLGLCSDSNGRFSVTRTQVLGYWKQLAVGL
ncbi:RING/U-box superfamily protein [Striga asiatica]|uniref:RING/U-box superfamily protein n=1 Tax=Striga asiatica TaxID=4170 RepID=A0A5A7PB17_STRAF|nr:RING/U-box superfamily protein [Striga asiatica]